MKQRKLSYRTPPCHRRPVTAHQCSAALQAFQTSTEWCLGFARGLPGGGGAGGGFTYKRTGAVGWGGGEGFA